MGAWGYFLFGLKCDACGTERIVRAGSEYAAREKIKDKYPGWDNRGHSRKVYCPKCAPGIPHYRLVFGQVDKYGREVERKKPIDMKPVREE